MCHILIDSYANTLTLKFCCIPKQSKMQHIGGVRLDENTKMWIRREVLSQKFETGFKIIVNKAY